MEVTEKQKILAEYKEKADEIIRKMLAVMVRAHKKVDAVQYKRSLEEINPSKK